MIFLFYFEMYCVKYATTIQERLSKYLTLRFWIYLSHQNYFSAQC